MGVPLHKYMYPAKTMLYDLCCTVSGFISLLHSEIFSMVGPING